MLTFKGMFLRPGSRGRERSPPTTGRDGPLQMVAAAMVRHRRQEGKGGGRRYIPWPRERTGCFLGEEERRMRPGRCWGGMGSSQARAGVCGRRGSEGWSLESQGQEPGAGWGSRRGDSVAITLPLGRRAGLRDAGCWLRGPAPPPIRLLRLAACSCRRLRCQQTRGASLPGPPLSNS